MTRTMDRGQIMLTRRGLFKIGGGAAAAVGVTALLAACGDAGAAGGSASGDITWGVQQFFSTQSTNKDVAATVKKALAAFEKKSGAKVTLQVQSSDNGAAMSRLLQQAAQGRAADAAMVDSYVFPRFAKYTKDITAVTKKNGVDYDDFFPFFQPLIGTADSVKGLPIHTDVRMLYYRKDLVSTPPTSWDELFKVAKPLADKGQYFLFPAGKDEDPIMCTVWPQYWAQGAEILDGDDLGFASGAGKEAMLNSLTFIKKCIDEGITPTRVSTFMVSDDMMPDLIGERVSMFIGGSWMATNMVAQGVKDVDSKWAVAPIPSMDGTNHATSSGGWMYAAFADDKKSLTNAAQFICDAYINTDAMAEFCTAAGYLPARQSAFSSPKYKSGQFTKDFQESLAKYAHARPGSPKYAEVTTAMQIAMSSVASQAATPEAALETALSSLS